MTDPLAAAADAIKRTERASLHQVSPIPRSQAAILANYDTATLIESAISLDRKERNSFEVMALAWLCEEIETRLGGITDDARFDQLLDQPPAHPARGNRAAAGKQSYLGALLAYFEGVTIS